MNGNLSDYQHLFDAISAMVWVILFDGTILAVNSDVNKKTGYTRDELVGNTVTTIHPPCVETEIQRILSEMATKNEVLCTLPIITKNGRVIDAETRIYRGTWEGKEVLFGFSTDVTEQKITEHKCRIIFHHSPIPILVSSTSDGRIIDCNNAWCELLGYSRDFVLGKTTLQLGVWQDERDRKKIIELFDEADSIVNAPVKFARCNGKTVYGLISATKILMNDEECWVTSLVDKTAEHVLEEQMDKIRDLSITAALEELDNKLNNNKYLR